MSAGKVEGRNQLLGDYLYSMKVNMQQSDWDQHLPYVQACMNSAYHESIDNTPFFLQHGRDYNFSFSDVLKTNPSPYIMNDKANEMHKKLRVAMERAQEISDLSHVKNQNKYNQQARPHKLTAGKLVLLKIMQHNPNEQKKLQPRFTGPFRLTRFQGPAGAYIRHATKPTSEQLVHTDRLKNYYGGQNLFPNDVTLSTNVPTSKDKKVTKVDHQYHLRDKN